MTPLTGPPTVRDAEAADWPGIGAVTGRSPAEAAALRRQLQQDYDPWIGLVAEDAADRIVGTIFCGVRRGASSGDPDRREARILWLEVLPSVRRRGIGATLLRASLDELRERDFTHAALLVDGGQFEALALFRALDFYTETETLTLSLPPDRAAALAAQSAMPGTDLRPLALDEVGHLAGLFVELGVERAPQPHDELPAFTPAELEQWLQRTGTVAIVAWEAGDPTSPLGMAWATRRSNEAALRFVGVEEQSRRRGIGRALMAAVVASAARPVGAGEGTAFRPVQLQLRDPADELAFFRALGFERESVTYELVRAL